MKTTVRVEGLKELEKALAELGEVPRRKVGRDALRAGGELTARAARDLAPVEDGDLRESIDVSGTLSRSQRASQKKVGADQEQFVGPGTNPQGIMQEFGTVNHPPQPFLRPAWDQTKDEVLKTIGDHLWVGLSKAQKSAARRAARQAAKAGK